MTNILSLQATFDANSAPNGDVAEYALTGIPPISVGIAVAADIFLRKERLRARDSLGGCNLRHYRSDGRKTI